MKNIHEDHNIDKQCQTETNGIKQSQTDSEIVQQSKKRIKQKRGEIKMSQTE